MSLHGENKAEVFARQLHNRLSSLERDSPTNWSSDSPKNWKDNDNQLGKSINWNNKNAQDSNDSNWNNASKSNWNNAQDSICDTESVSNATNWDQETSLNNQLCKFSSKEDIYYDIEVTHSPASPVEEDDKSFIFDSKISNQISRTKSNDSENSDSDYFDIDHHHSSCLNTCDSSYCEKSCKKELNGSSKNDLINQVNNHNQSGEDIEIKEKACNLIISNENNENFNENITNTKFDRDKCANKNDLLTESTLKINNSKIINDDFSNYDSKIINYDNNNNDSKLINDSNNCITKINNDIGPSLSFKKPNQNETLDASNNFISKDLCNQNNRENDKMNNDGKIQSIINILNELNDENLTNLNNEKLVCNVENKSCSSEHNDQVIDHSKKSNGVFDDNKSEKPFDDSIRNDCKFVKIKNITNECNEGLSLNNSSVDEAFGYNTKINYNSSDTCNDNIKICQILNNSTSNVIDELNNDTTNYNSNESDQKSSEFEYTAESNDLEEFKECSMCKDLLLGKQQISDKEKNIVCNKCKKKTLSRKTSFELEETKKYLSELKKELSVDKNEEKEQIENNQMNIQKQKEAFESKLEEIKKNLTEDYTKKSQISIEDNQENNLLKVENVSLIEDDDERPPRVRRCSSLKTGKTPPGTPGTKKIVRFADVLGLELSDVRTFLDEIPKVPKSAYTDLENIDILSADANTSCEPVLIANGVTERSLVPLFRQPGGEMNFFDRLRIQSCCLENACIQDAACLGIGGVVRVRNLDFNKSVHIRYSFDNWKTVSDLQANYIQNSCDGFSDKFTFILYCHPLKVGDKVEFAIRFQCNGIQYWDNNSGNNYSFKCVPQNSLTSANNQVQSAFPLSSPIESPWIHFTN